MKLDDPERYAREMKGDFSEIDAYINRQYYLQGAVFVGILICVIVAVLTW